eukprot:10664020-Prorocentrum_lima.AAC.1
MPEASPCLSGNCSAMAASRLAILCVALLAKPSSCVTAVHTLEDCFNWMGEHLSVMQKAIGDGAEPRPH